MSVRFVFLALAAGGALFAAAGPGRALITPLGDFLHRGFMAAYTDATVFVSGCF